MRQRHALFLLVSVVLAALAFVTVGLEDDLTTATIGAVAACAALALGRDGAKRR